LEINILMNQRTAIASVHFTFLTATDVNNSGQSKDPPLDARPSFFLFAGTRQNSSG
jgi:hypothetical protein